MAEKIGTMPMLAQGFQSANIQPVALGAIGNFADNITDGRGDVVAVDVMSQAELVDSVGASVVLKIGPKQILINTLSNFNYTAKPGTYCLTPLDAKGGQNIALTLDNTANASAAGVVPHLYFENPFLEDEGIQEAMSNGFLGVHSIDYLTSFAPVANRKQEGPKLNIPSKLGDVIGFELLTEGVNVADMLTSFSYLEFGGIDVIDEVCSGLGIANSTRPYRIFPIRVSKGQTFQYFTLTNGAANVSIGVRLYFDGIIK